MTTRIFFNPLCDHGRGMVKWEKIRGALGERLGPHAIEHIHSPDELPEQAAEAHRKGTRCFIAAGGDGTVHLLLNAVMRLPDTDSLCIGAIGLGSSNDSHKPPGGACRIDGIAVRIDAAAAKPVDIIRVAYGGSEEKAMERFCLNNASIGITAEANAFFNRRRPWMLLVQRFSVDAAVLAAAVRTMVTFRAIPCRLSIDQGPFDNCRITNLGIVKNLHFAGSLRYDTPVERDDGMVAVNLCHDMSRGETAGILAALSRGRFRGRPKTRTWMAHELRVECGQCLALEMDGEVVETQQACFTVVPKAIGWCA